MSLPTTDLEEEALCARCNAQLVSSRRECLPCVGTERCGALEVLSFRGSSTHTPKTAGLGVSSPSVTANSSEWEWPDGIPVPHPEALAHPPFLGTLTRAPRLIWGVTSLQLLGGGTPIREPGQAPQRTQSLCASQRRHGTGAWGVTQPEPQPQTSSPGEAARGEAAAVTPGAAGHLATSQTHRHAPAEHLLRVLTWHRGGSCPGLCSQGCTLPAGLGTEGLLFPREDKGRGPGTSGTGFRAPCLWLRGDEAFQGHIKPPPRANHPESAIH